MRTLPTASLRHLLRHPAQLALALVGLTLGVATIVAVDVATASARRAFELSLQAVNGAATHEITGGPGGIDEQVYVALRTRPLPAQGPAVRLAPVVQGYVTVGERLMQLAGIDPFASAALAAGSAGAAPAPALHDVAAARAWFTEPGAVILGASTARELGIGADGRFALSVGGVPHAAVVIARLADAGPGFAGLMLTDVAQAQEWLGTSARLSRIDLAVPADPAGTAFLAYLAASLPRELALHTTRATARETFAMTDAFTTNLRAMSLLALLVGTLLIYGAVSFAVLQRRRIIGVLRALGATRAEVLGIVLGEAALLGVAGAAGGMLLGVVIGHALVGLVAQTINDLYFVVAVQAVTVPWSTLLLAGCVGLGTALAAALLPALEVARSVPQLGLKRAVLERRVQRVAGGLALLSVLLTVGAGATILASQRSLLAGFAALFMLLLGVAALTPGALRFAAVAAARAATRFSPVARLACADVAASLSRTGVAIAALGMALTAMIGVAVMVESFRESLRTWLTQTMRADVYVSAPGVSESLERRLDPQVMRTLLAVPGVRAHSEGRRVTVDSPSGPVDLNAVSLVPASYAGFRLTAGVAAQAWPQFRSGAVLISEPLAWRLSLAPGSDLTLTTPSGPHAFTVAAVYREYGNDRGEVLIDLAHYRTWWHDAGVAALGLYLAPGISALSMGIFERTFLITRVLYWLAAGVAAVGLVSALLAWELERLGELALLRALGLTPVAAALLVLTQTAFMGVAAFLAALPAGLLTALTLIDVINRRAFGWQIDLHLEAAQFANALWLALAAAAAAALYPAWRSARMPLVGGLREE